MSVAKIDKSSVTRQGGRPELIIDGEKVAPLWYALSDIPAAKAWKDCSQRAIKNFAACGVDVVCVDTNLHECLTENGCDPSPLYKDISAVLQANPHAKVVTRLHINPPYWWLRQNPKEQIVFVGQRETDGQTNYVELERTDSGTYGDRTIARAKVVPTEIRASMASEKFLHDCGEMIKLLCRQVKLHPLGAALIGVQPAYGHCGEWHYWGTYNGSCEADYSEPMQKLFRKIVKERYQTETELQRFYGADATFENVTLASPKERENYREGEMLTPEKHTQVIDSMRTYSCAAAEAICYLCKCIKQENKDLLAGSFYGYFFSAESAFAAHGEVQKLFADENVDFLAGPCSYQFNKETGTANMLRYLPESCRLNGKLFIVEMDQGYRGWNGITQKPYVCESEEEYATLLKRNIMENILLGHGALYYDQRLPTVSIYEKEEYWNMPERLATIAEIQKICQRLLYKETKKTTDVLLVFDSERLYYQRKPTGTFELLQAIFKSGAGVDRIYLSDIEKCDISRYKCVLFVDCFVLDRKTYTYIQHAVLSGGRTVVFMERFAVMVEGETNESRFAEYIGALRADKYAEYEKENCRICIMPERIENRAFYHDLFKRAGAHIYTNNGEVVVADNEMVMVHCKDIPHTTLHLPCGNIELENGKYNTAVYNIYTGKKLL